MAPHADIDEGFPLSTRKKHNVSQVLTPPIHTNGTGATGKDTLATPVDISRSASPMCNEGLNIIISMGGIGSRFQKEGYRFPKPLMKIVGRPMLCWLVERLSVTAQDTIWLAVNEDVENEFQITQLMSKWFPKLHLFIVAQSMPASHRRRRTISLDCDTVYFFDIVNQVRQLPNGHGGCFYIEDTGSQPIFSYIQQDQNHVITNIQEKTAISTYATTGAYVFPSGSALQNWASHVLDSKLDPNLNDKVGEYYTSQPIEVMIKTGNVPFSAIPVQTDEFSCVGTPRQLDEFLLKISSQNFPTIKPQKQRFCFDLHMTLVGMPELPGDYSTCPPIWNNIELVRSLHKAGHYVIIQMVRRMRTHGGNVGAVIADIGAVTIASLAKYKTPYDEIFFGKPYAHIYVDDLAVNANIDTRKEIGWLATDLDGPDIDNPLAELRHAQKAGIVPSRDFNHVQIVGEKVMKSSKSDRLLAEISFYSHLPDAILDLFPRLYATNYSETATYSFTMEKMQGVSYSHLLTGRSLSAGRLQVMLEALHRIHNCPSAGPGKPISSDIAAMFAQHAAQEDVDIYVNYAKKMKSRYEEHRAVYRALGETTTSRLYQSLMARLEAYEEHNCGVSVAVIHGDPVFSNVVLNEAERCVAFFDVRSQLGSQLTMAGDACYDLAKVLQSLQGYDYLVLSDEEMLLKANTNGKGLGLLIKPEDRVLLVAMQEVFWKFVEDNYGGRVDYHDLLTLVASLFFTLIPWHRKVVQPLFLQMCWNIVEHDTACPL